MKKESSGEERSLWRRCFLAKRDLLAKKDSVREERFGSRTKIPMAKRDFIGEERFDRRRKILLAKIDSDGKRLPHEPTKAIIV